MGDKLDMIIILTALNLLSLFILMAGIFNTVEAIKTSVLMITVFSFLYAIISGLLFTIDKFSFNNVLLLILALTVFLNIVLIKKNVICIRKIHSCKSFSSIEVVLIGIAFLLSFQNFELYANGQDQGLYQAEAIELYMGNYEVEHDYEEFQLLESEEDKEVYLEMLRSGIVGYYPLSDYYERIGFKMSEPISAVSGMYHGVQTFPAILALGGKLFGLENMMQIQTVFFICSVLLLYYMLHNMEMPVSKRLGALAVFLLSPLVLWISKTAFTEMLLTLCVSFYLFILTETNTWLKRYLLSLPLVAFSFIHVSFLIIYPVFILIHMFLFFQSGKKEYIYINLITSIGLSVGYFVMARIAPQYFFDNVARLYYEDIITIHNFLFWVLGGCVLASICSLLLLLIKDLSAVYQKIILLCKVIPILVVVFLGVIFFNVVVIGYFRAPENGWRASLCSYYGKGLFNALSHSSLFAFAMATGFFVIFGVLWYVMRYHRDIWRTPIEIAVCFQFLYCVLFQSAFIREEVHYYYYYSRYLVYCIPVICVGFALFCKRIQGHGPWVILAISVVSMLFFDIPMLREKDQTSLEWETLQDLKAAIQDDSAIILSSDMADLLGPKVKSLSGGGGFPVMSDVKNEVELLKKHYSNVYYISTESLFTTRRIFNDMDVETIYRDRYLQQDTWEFNGHFPFRYSSNEREMILYRIITHELNYELNSKLMDSSISGFSGRESTGRWTCENEAVVACYLPSANYNLTIEVNSVPLENLGFDNYTANVSINDIYLGDIVIAPDKRDGSYQFNVPKEYLQNGSNVVSFNCERLWSPSSYGSNDSRTLGIFVRSILWIPED